MSATGFALRTNISLIHKSTVGEVYNISGCNEMKNIDIVKIFCKAFGKLERLITYVADRKECGYAQYVTDSSKIHNELGLLT